jgi:hypothetical protein
MSNAVALVNEVYGIFQAPAGLGLRDRADSHWTCRNIDTSRIAEATAATRGHIDLWLLPTRTDDATSKTTPVDPDGMSSGMTRAKDS